MHGRSVAQERPLGGWRTLAAAASVLTVLALGPSAGAQDGADSAEPAETADSQPADTAAEAERRGSAPAERAPQPRAAGNASDDVFVPTEEIAADEEVVFPVDI